MPTVIVALGICIFSFSPFSDQSKLARKPIRAWLAWSISPGITPSAVAYDLLVGLSPRREVGERPACLLDTVISILILSLPGLERG